MLDKYEFMRLSIKFLEHIVSEEGIQHDSYKKKELSKNVPNTKKCERDERISILKVVV